MISLKYKKVTFFAVAVGIFLFVQIAFGRSIDPCKSQEIRFNGHLIQTHKYAGKNSECLISVADRSSPSMKYQRLMWSTDGEFMAFYSFGQGSQKENTGAQSYYFLPQRNSLKLDLVGTSAIVVTTPSGVQMSYNTATRSFDYIEGVDFRHNYDFDKNQPDWIHFNSANSPTFDLGFKMGSSPKEDMFGKVKFMMAGYECRSINLHVFSYGGEEPTLRIQSQSDIDTFLEQSCVKNN